MDDALRRELREQARSLRDFLVATRREIHAHPELGHEEKRTSELIVRELEQMGAGEFEVRRGVAGTGVVATLRGALPGSTIALRADMDALPLDEQDDRPYRSCVRGVMHACGHDGHVAMLLGAARVLHKLRHGVRGNVRFLFQPAEETYGGASEMISDGCLTAPPAVDAVFGLHLEPLSDVGELRIRRGPLMASSDAIRIVVQGRGGHASEPHECIDPVPVAAQIITSLQTLVTRRFDARSPVVVTITYVQAGSTFNVIPSEVVLAGTVRAVGSEVRKSLQASIERAVQHTAAALDAEAQVSFVPGSGVVVNDAPFTDLVAEVARNARGVDSVSEMPQPVMTGEDFGEYLERVPGAFAFLGARPSHQEAFPCHHPRFDIDENALPIGVEILASVALEYLSQRAT